MKMFAIAAAVALAAWYRQMFGFLVSDEVYADDESNILRFHHPLSQEHRASHAERIDDLKPLSS